MAIRSISITGEGAALPGNAVGMLMSRNPPADRVGDYVQPTWLAWQARDQSTYEVWLSRQLPRIRNRARLEARCEISGAFHSSLRGTVRPTGQTWMLLVVPLFMCGIGGLILLGLVHQVFTDPIGGLQGAAFPLAWLAAVVFIFRSFLLLLRRTYESLLAELSYAIGGEVGPAGSPTAG
jgi:hypothetical protein